MPYMQAMRKFSQESWNEDTRRLSKLSGYSNLLRAEREEPRRVPAICSFQHTSTPALLPTQPPVQLVLVLFPRSKATPSSAEFK